MKKSIGPKTLVYPTPVFAIGTYDKAGKPNVMTAAWGGICCSTPPCVAVVSVPGPTEFIWNALMLDGPPQKNCLE